MSYTLSPNLRLRLDSNLTANAKFNLLLLDQQASFATVAADGTTQFRARENVTLTAHDPAAGGDGIGGSVTIGSASQPLSSFTVYADSIQLIDNTGGDWVTLNGTQTLTHKSMDGAANTFTNIPYGALSLAGSIVNADVSPTAAIAYSKLNLASSIRNADVSPSAAITYSKLNLTASLVDADVAAAAAIAGTKVAPDFGSQDLQTSGSLKLKSGGNSIALKAPGGLGTPWTLTLPPTPGSSNYVLTTDGAGNSFWSVAGVGTVISVGLAAPAEFSVTGSPVSNTGTITLAKVPQAANTLYAGPAAGGSLDPTFRTLANADLASTTAPTSLTGDVSAIGPGAAAATVNSVGGSAASAIHTAELAANAATDVNTASTIVKRDSSGNFAAGTITAALSGNATTATMAVSATSFTGSLSGDVTGTQSATVVALVGGSSATNVHSAELAANAATNLNTASTIVKRDSSGNFAAGTITAALTGTASGNPPNARLINTTAPLTGGGDLSADRTLAIPQSTGAADGYLSATDWATFNAKQPAGNYITALTGDITATGPGSVGATLTTHPHTRYVDFISGNDSTGTGSVAAPWKTLSHANASVTASINTPYVFYIAGGNNDTDVGTLNLQPNISLVADYPIQVVPLINISGGITNDGSTFTNIIFIGGLTWTRNDATDFGITFYNCQFFSGPTVKQTGSGNCTITAYDSLFVNSDWQSHTAPAVFFNCTFYGTLTMEDATSAAYYEFVSCYFSSSISISGGVEAYFAGCAADVPFGYTLSGATTANGTPLFQFDSASVPPTISGSFTSNLTSQSKWTAYVPATPANWSVTPATVAAALDTLGTIAGKGPVTVANGGTGLASLGSANTLLGVNAGATANEYKSLSVGTSGTDFNITNTAGAISLNIPDAGASARGLVTTGTQTLAGAKTFSNDLTLSTNLIYTITNDSTTTGANAALAHPTTFIRLTNASLTSIGSLQNAGNGHTVVVMNLTGSRITIVNNYGAAPSGYSPVLTATGADITVPTNGGVQFIRSTVDSAWLVFAINRGVQQIADGGTGAITKAAGFDALQPMSAAGDLIYGGASGTGTRLPVGSTGQSLKVVGGNPAWSTTGFAATWALADGTTKTVTHNLGTRDVEVQLYDLADFATIGVDSAVRTDTNTLTLTSSVAPNASGWRVLIRVIP